MQDPTKTPVHIQVRVPWDFKDFLRRKANDLGKSQNQLVTQALYDAYGHEFTQSQAKAPR